MCKVQKPSVHIDDNQIKIKRPDSIKGHILGEWTNSFLGVKGLIEEIF